MQVKISMILCAKISDGMWMENVSTRLRELRKQAKPRITVRALAAELDLPLGTYSFYESPTKYKKPALPLDLTRRIAAIFARHGVDPNEVMKLAGLSDQEAEPEAREIEAQRSALQWISLPVALPSEAALRDMFRSLLVLVPEGATKDEAAEILARRLPSGLAAIGPLALDPIAAASLAAGEAPRFPATDHPESEQAPRT